MLRIIKLVKRVLQSFKKQPIILPADAIQIPRDQHNISRKSIPAAALKVLYRLRENGFQAYLVGGCVRDLLLEYYPKDFDVVTDARPEQIKRIFTNCRLIGRRFRLAHIHFGREIIEVATFRGKQAENEKATHQIKNPEGLIIRDNVYGTIEEDAWRRDFTINALYYNIADFSVIDFVGGVSDLKQKILRIIGEPTVRYREDPVRMLRAIRFAAKLNLQIEEKTAAAIPQLGHLLQHIPTSRLFEESLKLFHGGAAEKTYQLLKKYDLFKHLLPLTAHFLAHAPSKEENFLLLALRNTDQRIQLNKSVNPAFIYATLLWQPLQARAQEFIAQYLAKAQAFAEAEALILREQLHTTSIPKRITIAIRDIWHLQHRLSKRYGEQAFQLMTHKRFRAAYDLLLLRAESGDNELSRLANWWTQFQEADEGKKIEMVEIINKQRQKRSQKRKKQH